MSTEPVNVLWTSGWDSTFRVADLLLRQGKNVQPWYVMDSNRRSTMTELATLKRMREMLIERDASVASRLLPPKVHRIEDIPADPTIGGQHQELAARSHIGGQYAWLARLAKANDVVLELSIHRDDKAHGFLDGHVEVDSDGTYRLPSSVADNALRHFQWFTFPLFDVSKLDMQEQAQQNGFGDIMELTWFCFTPLPGRTPCGRCNPCKYTAEEGLGRRIPANTPWRTLQYKALQLAWRARRVTRRPVAA